MNKEREIDFIKNHCRVEKDGSIYTLDRGVYLDNRFLGVNIISMILDYDMDEIYAYRDMRKSQKSCVACCGFSSKNQKWYGWTHRGIRSFGIGDNYLGGQKAKTLEDCKKLAWRAVMALS